MIEPILVETLDDWADRTNLRRVVGQTTIHGAPLDEFGPTQRFYTFDGSLSKEEIEDYFNDLYLNPGSNLWRWKKIEAEPVAHNFYSGFVLKPIEWHR